MQEENVLLGNIAKEKKFVLLRTGIDKTIEITDLYMDFMDLTAAFENVSRNQISTILEEKKVPAKLIDISMTLYMTTKQSNNKT